MKEAKIGLPIKEQRYGIFPAHKQVVNRVINTPRPVLGTEVKDGIKRLLHSIMTEANKLS